jgi:uncharacterized protein (DUF433 family)
MKPSKRVEFGEYIVADPEICHGQLTFKGTRLLVKDLLYFVAKGCDWDTIATEFHGLPHAAIAEAINLASAALLEQTVKPKPAPRAEKRRAA